MSDGIRRQAVEIMGIPIELDDTMPHGTFAIRERSTNRLLGQWETETVQNDRVVADYVARLLIERGDDVVPFSGPGDAPAGTNLVGLGDIGRGPLEQHLASGRRMAEFVEPRPEIHRPRLRQVDELAWIDVDEIVGIDVVRGDLGFSTRTVQIAMRGGGTRTVVVDGTDPGDARDMPSDADADRLALEWVAQRFGDITGTDVMTLAGLDELFGLKP